MRLLAAALLALSGAALAQATGDDLAALRRDFEFGKYDQVLQSAQGLIDGGAAFNSQALLELHQMAGLSAFNLGQPKDAERHLSAVLRIDPDFVLDPFVYPPATIGFLERIRRELSPELEGIRQERRLEAARRRSAAEAAERERIRAEEQRRSLEALTRRTTIRTVERRQFFVNLVPFGTGQFQQGRMNLGIFLASAEGALAATSIVAYWAHEALLQDRLVTVPGVMLPGGAPYTVKVRGIPQDRAAEAQAWRLIKTISGIGFYGLYAYGVADAALRHKDELVTTETVTEPPPPPPPAPPAQPPPPDERAALRIGAFLAPEPGGLSAGLTLVF